MTRRRRTLLAVIVATLLAAGSATWYWNRCQETAVDRRVRAHLDLFRRDRPEPGWFEGRLISVGLMKDRRPCCGVPHTIIYEIYGPATVPALMRALKDNDAGVREAAARGLGKVGDARAVAPLKELLSDSNPHVQTAAKQAIDQIRAKAATHPATETQAVAE